MKKETNSTFFFLAGCLMAGQMGMSIFPFMGWSLMTAGTMMQLTQTAISYNTYMALMVILIVVMMVTYPLLMKLCGCKFDKMADVDIVAAFPNVKGDDKITQRQSLAIWSVVVFIVVMVILSMFSSNIAILNTINLQIGVLGLMMILWIFCHSIPYKRWEAFTGYARSGRFLYLGHVDADCGSVIDFSVFNQRGNRHQFLVGWLANANLCR